ncbi:MAG: NGG1p interacting factor NIF3 [Candidatus Omnitrophota bacterium]|nr:MAG: NGG1p interacting factor NIF3 [Candidatus Omnitrophota bacterium]
MKLSRLYNQVLKFGRDKDPRTKKSKISYADTALLYGDPDTRVNKVMVGIDIDAAEILLADKIRKSQGLDLVISHHPEGRAWAGFYKVMQLQVDMMVKAGIGRKEAQEMLDERMQEVERRVLPQNHMRTVDAARILDMPLMCAHTPADNHVSDYIYKLLARKKPKIVEDILAILKEIPEYKEADRELSGPRIILGSPKRNVGKVFVEMTGGTEGSKEVYANMHKRGIRTLVSMHLSEEHFKKVKDANLNVVIAGHISSDTLGLNLLLDRIEKEEPLEVIACSGFRRFKHNL